MPLPFVGRAAKGGGGRKHVVLATGITIDQFDLAVGTKQVTVHGTGITHIGWSVFANSPPTYPWYGGGGDNIALVNGAATITVQLFNIGDRLKVFKSAATGGAGARDLSVQAESGYATAAPSGQPGSTGPAAIHSKMGLGINQERFSVFHSGAGTPQYYQRYRDMGVQQIRFFPPVGDQGWQIAISSGSVGNVQPYLDAAMACVQSGMAITHFDMCDVQGYETMGSALYDYVQAIAERMAQMNFPTDSFIVGAVNEYAGGNNGAYQPHRVTMNNRIRAALPNHTVVENGCNWGDPQALVYPNNPGYDGVFGNFVPWSDTNSIVQVHHYLGWDLSGLVNLFEDVKRWSDANGRKVFIGEHGFNDGNAGASGRIGEWIGRMDEHSQQLAVARLKPTLWAVTDGDAWRMNEIGGNTMRPGMDSGVPRWATRINNLNAGATTPDPDPPPPPPPVSGDVLNIVVRGQSNALLFCNSNGIWTMRDQLQQATGRTVNVNYAWDGGTGHWSIFSGTPFLNTDTGPGWQQSGRQESLRLFLTEIPANQRNAPFLFLWMHNEDDQKNFGHYTQADWVQQVRDDAAIMRGTLGLSAADSRYYFVKIRYNFGNPSTIFAGMNQLAADSSFNAYVSDVAMAANMDYDGVPDGSHMSDNDARNIIAPAMATQLAGLYP